MKTLKSTVLTVCMAIFLMSPGVAQEEIKAYLSETTPLILSLQENIQNFMGEVQPLRQNKDIVGLKDVADKYIGVWDGMLGQLGQVEPGPETQRHYQALRQLFEMQRKSNQIMSETLGQRIELLVEIQQMKENGATDDEVKEFAADNSLDREALLEETSAVKAATKEADETLKSEHKRLTGLVAGTETEEN